MDVRAHIEPEAAGLPRRYRKIQIIRDWLQKLIDQPYDEKGQRLSLRIDQQYRSAVKTAASDLNIHVKCENYDTKWMKVMIVEPGAPCGPGRAPGSGRGRIENFRKRS